MGLQIVQDSTDYNEKCCCSVDPSQPSDYQLEAHTTPQEAFDYLQQQHPGIPISVNINPHDLELK